MVFGGVERQLQNRIFFEGDLSSRDTNAVNEIVNGLMKLFYPGYEQAVLPEELKWPVRVVMKSRHRV